MTLTPKEIEGLRALLDKATPGEWFAFDDNDVCTRAPIEANVVCLSPENPMQASLEKWPDNRALIVAMRNSFKPLLEEVVKLRDERATIVDWLRRDAGKTADDLRRLHARQKLTPGQTKEWEILIELKMGLAGAIERGEHHLQHAGETE